MSPSPASQHVFIGGISGGVGAALGERLLAEGHTVAKGGLNGLAQALAASYAPFGVRVNAVALGLVETGATRSLLSSAPARQVSASMHPTGTIGSAEAVASLLTWLLSPDADWMTGEILPLDGGMSAVLPKPRASASR